MKETAAFVCSHVFEATRPVLLVCRDRGHWMYLCGDVNEDDEKYCVIGREHLLERDETLLESLDLRDQMEMERKVVGGPWERREFDSD
jgi:hypothetical protein